ncbi:MAG: hypothetical protein JWO38_287 [Gemmataceae bacterium]|nr:hypothetical protein [Gemmataceae bacterium]
MTAAVLRTEQEQRPYLVNSRSGPLRRPDRPGDGPGAAGRRVLRCDGDLQDLRHPVARFRPHQPGPGGDHADRRAERNPRAGNDFCRRRDRSAKMRLGRRDRSAKMRLGRRVLRGHTGRQQPGRQAGDLDSPGPRARPGRLVRPRDDDRRGRLASAAVAGAGRRGRAGADHPVSPAASRPDRLPRRGSSSCNSPAGPTTWSVPRPRPGSRRGPARSDVRPQPVEMPPGAAFAPPPRWRSCSRSPSPRVGGRGRRSGGKPRT